MKSEIPYLKKWFFSPIMCSIIHFNTKHMYLKSFLLMFMFQPNLFTEKKQDNSSNKINLADCGVSKRFDDTNSRIVGGKKVNITRYPWTVSFQKKLSEKGELEHFCGGSIINQRWLLSASHCFQGVRQSIKKVRAVVGTTQWNGTSGATYEVDKLIMHEKYNSFNYANDIALIKTKTAVQFKSDSKYFHTNSVCLTALHSMPESANVYGWGLLGEYSGGSFDLMRTTLNKVNLTKCNQVYKQYIGQLTKQMMCYAAPGKDACQVSLYHKGKILVSKVK